MSGFTTYPKQNEYFRSIHQGRDGPCARLTPIGVGGGAALSAGAHISHLLFKFASFSFRTITWIVQLAVFYPSQQLSR